VRVSDRPMARGRSKPCAAGPSVEMGPAPSKQNTRKTVAGQSARCENCGAKEGEDRQEELKSEAVRRATAANQFIGRVMSVASQAVEESRARKEPLLAMVGRFTRPGECGCNRCLRWRPRQMVVPLTYTCTDSRNLPFTSFYVGVKVNAVGVKVMVIHLAEMARDASVLTTSTAEAVSLSVRAGRIGVQL